MGIAINSLDVFWIAVVNFNLYIKAERNVFSSLHNSKQQIYIKNEKYLKSINNLNEIVNYMVNYAKGYTRNGVRNDCWITGQGDPEYITRVMNGVNMKQKYENFEKVRELCQEDNNCKELISNYERIINYYLVRI